MKYDVCPYCGANLDHGEKCECRDAEEEEEDRQSPEKIKNPDRQ